MFASKSDRKSPVVIYLHGNASCRLEGAEYSRLLLAKGLSLFVFDAAGCGLSEGEFVTLGWHEHRDLALIVDHLLSLGKFSSVVLWGRSMGAVTALLYLAHAETHQSAVSCAVLDSSFSDLNAVIESVAGQSAALRLLAALFVPQIKQLVFEKTGMQVDEFNVAERAAHITMVPALFCHGEHDDFVLPRHSEQNYAAYGCAEKEIWLVPGDHNAPRPATLLRKILAFLEKHSLATPPLEKPVVLDEPTASPPSSEAS